MAARTFEDSTGALWEVFEVHRTSTNAGVSAGLEKGWLAFVSGPTKRRLAPFPPDWESATPMELERLCAAARAALQPRITGRETPLRPRLRRPDWAGVSEPPTHVSAEHAPRRGDVGDGLVVPEAETEPGAGGERESVEATVRAFAHQARTLGLPAIEAMMRLRALLLKEHPAPDSEARDKRRVRRWFVEAYYFERNA
jgi:hypothetical protein